ncbi:MAG: energy transducer TonB [Thermodesulfovibrionales bacterium]
MEEEMSLRTEWEKEGGTIRQSAFGYETKGLRISLVSHGLVFLLMLWLGSGMAPEKKPIVIDFTIQEPAERGLRDEDLQKKAAPEKRIALKKESKTALPATKTAVHETERVLPDTPASPVSSQPALSPVAHTAATPARAEGIAGASSAHETARISGPAKGVSSGETTIAVREDTEESAKNRYTKEHFAYIADLIMKNRSYPVMARKMGWEGRAVVSFVVCENGSVEDVRIAKTTGFPILDKNAVETVKKACPFPKPPVRAELSIPVVYRLQ